jgi:hypothetical protein
LLAKHGNLNQRSRIIFHLVKGNCFEGFTSTFVILQAALYIHHPESVCNLLRRQLCEFREETQCFFEIAGCQEYPCFNLANERDRLTAAAHFSRYIQRGSACPRVV